MAGKSDIKALKRQNRGLREKLNEAQEKFNHYGLKVHRMAG